MNCLCNMGKSGLVLPPTSVAVAKGIKTWYLQGFERATVFKKTSVAVAKRKVTKKETTKWGKYSQENGL